jgi:hypothetical protein
MADPEQDEFRVDLTFSGRSHAHFYAAAVAVVIIGFIVLTMTTNIASYLLPMEDQYLQAMIPRASDGAEPLSLRLLEHEINGNMITVRGMVANRTDFPVMGILTVVNVIDTTGRFPQTVEAPVEPAEIPVQGTAAFQAVVATEGKPSTYTVRFRFADGPFLPHKDDRASAFESTEGSTQ